MSNSVTLAPSNALIFIADSSGGDVPEFLPEKQIMSTTTGILVHCLPDMDGDTTVTLGKLGEVARATSPVYDGVIELPTKRLRVSTVEDDGILFATVPKVETRICIWTNRALDPDDIVIGWSDAAAV